MSQLSQSGRIVYVVAISQGNCYYAASGDTSWTTATNTTGDSPALNYTGVVFSTSANQKLYFADGVNWAYFDPSAGTINRWSATSGILPVDSDNNTPRLICTWRGRVVLSGLIKDPQNWFVSKVNDPTDFNYGDPAIPPTMAIAGNNAPQGLVGDVITSLCPYSDDVLLFFGDHTIYKMSGDPMENGHIDLVSDTIGGAWGICWCKDPYGTVYFLSNKMGIYSLRPDQQPQRISQAVEQLLVDLDSGTNNFRLLWDDRFQGLHVFISPLGAPATTTHLFYEQRTGAWWQDRFASTNYDPLACCVIDGNTPGDRVAVIGSWDGYVRTISPTATTDDGSAISSSVVVGPLVTENLDEILFKDLQGVLGETSGSVTWSAYVGASAEKALSSTAIATGTWAAGRNLTSLIRRSGHALYIKVTATNAWALEQVRSRVASQGKVRGRGR